MKFITSLLVACLLCFTGMAQQAYPSNFTKLAPNKFRAQLINTSNALPNAVLDTATDATALYLTVAKRNTSNLGVAYPLLEGGKATVIVTGVKISGTVAGTISLEQSFDGTIWAPYKNSLQVPVSTTTGTVTTTYGTNDAYTMQNVSTVQSTSIEVPELNAPYLRVKVGGSGTQSSSWRAYICLTRKPGE